MLVDEAAFLNCKGSFRLLSDVFDRLGINGSENFFQMSVVETAWLPDTRGMVFCWWGFRVHMLSGTRMFLGTIEHPAPTHPTPKKDLDYASSSQLGQVRSHQRAFTSMGDVHRLACLSNKQTPKLYVSKAIPV